MLALGFNHFWCGHIRFIDMLINVFVVNEIFCRKHTDHVSRNGLD